MGHDEPMSKVVAVEYVTLDGVFEEPAWSGPYFNEELSGWQARNLAEADALLLGRKTYEGFKAAWPQMEEATGDFGVKMNSMPKHVATTTLTVPDWNATFLPGEVADAVVKLRTEAGNRLIKPDGTRDEVVSVTQADYFGKVYNLKPASTNRVANILIAQGFLVGSSRFQNEDADFINRIILGRGIPANVIPR